MAAKLSMPCDAVRLCRNDGRWVTEFNCIDSPWSTHNAGKMIGDRLLNLIVLTIHGLHIMHVNDAIQVK